MLRFVCTNSMIADVSLEEVRIHHKRGIQDQIIESTDRSNVDHANSGAHHQTASNSNVLTADCHRFHTSSSQAIFGHPLCGNRRCLALLNCVDFENFGAPHRAMMTTTFTP
ncbi:hypothetical protein [Methylocystis echinoides]|uniref:hypothetical protein n=1 Tax=Methylocystis echinoides TaxID=29468 RepID=UPI003D819E61